MNTPPIRRLLCRKMAELCTQKRMLITIFVIIGLSVILLAVEYHWSNKEKINEFGLCKDLVFHNGSCLPTASPFVVQNCHKCTRLELRCEAKPCMKTGLKELVQCGSTKMFQPCDITPDKDKKDFWTFEALMCTIGLVSYGVVRYRQKKLDSLLRDKVNRQIASGL